MNNANQLLNVSRNPSMVINLTWLEVIEYTYSPETCVYSTNNAQTRSSGIAKHAIRFVCVIANTALS